MRLSTVLSSLAAFAMLIGFVPSADAATLILKGGSSVATGNWAHICCEKWKQYIEEASKGAITVENYPNAALGNDNAMVEKAMMGAIQWTYASTSNLSRFVKELNTYELPYLAEDPADNLKLFYKDGKLGGPITERIQKELKKKNLRLMWITTTFHRSMLSTKFVKKPEDSKGMKIRVTASELERASVTSWGAGAVPMGYGECYTSLQQGTIEGLGQNIADTIAAKFQEVCKYLTENKFNSYSHLVVMNLDTFNSLSPEMQKIVCDASDAVAKFSYENVDSMYFAPAYKEAEKAGMTIYRPTDEEMNVWRKVTMDAVWPKAVGKLVDSKYLEEWKKLLGK